MKDVHDFYHKLSRVVRTLNTMKKTDKGEGHICSILNKLGSGREVLAQKDDNLESWRLNDLTENLRKYVDRIP